MENIGNNHFFSVITSVYNAEKFILKAMNSVKNQDETDYEYIIVDNGSTDGSAELIRGFINDNPELDIKLIEFRENQGISGGRNAGIEKAGGQYICFLDADDYWYENKLSQMREEIKKHPECQVFCHWETHIENECESLGAYRDIDNTQPYADLLFHGNCLSTSANVIQRELIQQIKGFDTNLVSGEEDYDCWLRLARGGAHFHMVHKPLGVWLIRNDSVSAKRINHTEAVVNMLVSHFENAATCDLVGVEKKKLNNMKKGVLARCYMGCGRGLSLHGSKTDGNNMYRKAIKINPCCWKAYAGMILNLFGK